MQIGEAHKPRDLKHTNPGSKQPETPLHTNWDNLEVLHLFDIEIKRGGMQDMQI